MAQQQLNREEIAELGRKWYADSIRRAVETEANVGNMVIIDVETGDYAVDSSGLESAKQLYAKNPDANLYGIRIGYRAADAIGGAMERLAS